MVDRMPDAIFADPRLAALYDTFDGDRDDLALYLAVVEESGARSVLDVGCGTGSFACLLAGRGVEVVGVDVPVRVRRAEVTSYSTLRFRDREELESSLDAADHAVENVREAPDRPGHEFVVIARRRDGLTGRT